MDEDALIGLLARVLELTSRIGEHVEPILSGLAAYRDSANFVEREERTAWRWLYFMRDFRVLVGLSEKLNSAYEEIKPICSGTSEEEW